MGTLTLDIYRSDFDATLGGISSKAQQLTVVGTVDGPKAEVQPLPDSLHLPSWKPNATHPPVALAVRRMGSRRYVQIVPAHLNEDGSYTARQDGMNGGNFGYTSDSRFSEIVAQLSRVDESTLTGPLSIMDRFES